MYDHFNRRINYLRISVTDRCNLRCRYCMECEKIGIPISEFADLAIQSMLPISETLGL